MQTRQFCGSLAYIKQAHYPDYAGIELVNKVAAYALLYFLERPVNEILRARRHHRQMVDCARVVRRRAADFLIFVGVNHSSAAYFFKKLREQAGEFVAVKYMRAPRVGTVKRLQGVAAF